MDGKKYRELDRGKDLQSVDLKACAHSLCQGWLAYTLIRLAKGERKSELNCRNVALGSEPPCGAVA